jgi:hypothetical protein
MSVAERALLRRRILLALLVLSLAVNAFFIGVALTDLWRTRPAGGGASRLLRIELRWMERGLTPEGVERVETAVKAIQPEVETRLAKIRALRGEVKALAAAPAPDRAAIDAKIAEVRTESAAIARAVEKATYDALLALPPEMRKGLRPD